MHTQLLELTHAGLQGPLPYEMMCLQKLRVFEAARNHLSGSIPTVITNGWISIEEIDLSRNELEGELPALDWHNPKLSNLDLSYNRLSGSIQDQVSGLIEQVRVTTRTASPTPTHTHNPTHPSSFALSQALKSGFRIKIDLDGNLYSGPLPREMFYPLFTDPQYVEALAISMNGNRMLCDPETGKWPGWLHRQTDWDDTSGYYSGLGKCTPLAIVSSADIMVPGEFFRVQGRSFIASDQLKCKIGNQSYPAAFVNEAEVLCGPVVAADFVRGQTYPASVANFGSDFYSKELAGSSAYRQVATTLAALPPARLSQAELAGIAAGVAVGVLLLVAAAAGVIWLVLKRRKETLPTTDMKPRDCAPKRASLESAFDSLPQLPQPRQHKQSDPKLKLPPAPNGSM